MSRIYEAKVPTRMVTIGFGVLAVVVVIAGIVALTKKSTSTPRQENYGDDARQYSSPDQEPWAKRYWWVFLILAILIVSGFTYLVYNKETPEQKFFRLNRLPYPQ